MVALGTREEKKAEEVDDRRFAGDWITTFCRYTENLNSPKLFRKWSAIWAIGAAAERRCWTTLNDMPPLYPNTFVILVATPGVGKGVAINGAVHFLKGTKSLFIGPETMTKAALVDELKESHKFIKHLNMEYHSLIVPSVEFGCLLPEWDSAFVNTLNDLFDARLSYKERTRGKGIIEIANPQLSLIGGTQPDYLAMTLPQEAWGTGFTARNILVFSKENKKKSLFGHKKRDPAMHDALLADMKRVTQLHGEFDWDIEAAKALDEWNLADADKPTIAKLEHYATRRHLHLIKLMMVASLSRGDDLKLLHEDFETALSWLLEAEKTMPEIFRNMTISGDPATQDDVRRWCQEEEVRRKTGLAEHTIINYMRTRMKMQEVRGTFDMMVRAHMFREINYGANGKMLFTAFPEDKPPMVSYTSTRHHALTPPSPPLHYVPARYILRVTEEEEDHRLPEDEEFYPNGSE